MTEHLKFLLRDTYSNFAEAYCNLTNSFAPISSYFDFSQLFGASNCSSTTGGRPESAYIDDNVFLLIQPPPGTGTLLSLDAQQACATASGDPLLLQQLPLASILALVQRIGVGIPQ